MANVALAKPVLEGIKRRELVTDGNVIGYTGTEGFAYFRWPGNVTVDLGSISKIRCVRFLLWDGLGGGIGEQDSRKYGYRFLISRDSKDWTVVYETPSPGYNGWQEFRFPNGIEAQYIRIHGLWNTANPDFHLVELEAYDDEPPPLVRELTNAVIVSPASLHDETIEGLPLTGSLKRTIETVEDLERFAEAKSDELNPEKYRNLASELRMLHRDVGIVERGYDAIRRRILDPVERELSRSSKLGRVNLTIAILTGLLSIIALALTIYMLWGKI